MINCKVELKLKWTSYCVFSAAGGHNANANPNNLIFTIRDTKLYVPVLNLSAKIIRDYQKFLAKDLNDQFIGMNKNKTKGDNIYTANEFRYFLKSNFAAVNRLSVLVYTDEDADF